MAEAWQLQWQTNKDIQPTSNVGASNLTINAVNANNQTQPPTTAQPAAQTTTPTQATTAIPTAAAQTQQAAAQTQQVKQKTSLPVFVERQAAMKLDKYVTDQSLFDAFLNKDIGQNELTYLKETDPARYKALQTYTQWTEAKAKITAYRDNLQKSTTEVVDATPVSPYQKAIDDLTTKSQEFYDSQIKQVSALSTTYSAQDIYNSTVNTKELEAKQQAMIDAKAEVEKYNDMIKNLENDVRGRYPWASESFIARMVAREAKDITVLQDTALTKYNTALSDYQATQENSQMQFKLALDDAQRQEDLQRKQLEQTMNITKDAFQRNREVTTLQINKLLQDEQFAKEQQLKEYRFNKDLQSKVYLSQLDQEQQKAMMEYESQLKLNYYNDTKDHNVSYQEIDGKTYIVDSDNNIVWLFDSNVAGFKFDMNLTRTWTNVGVDANNPWNITADWFTTQEAKANYWTQIGAVGTYTSPNGREYYVFPTLDAWAKAQRDFASRIVNWQSSNYWSSMTLWQVARTYVGKNGDPSLHISEVISRSWWKVNANTPISQVDKAILAEWFAYADSGIDISGLWLSDSSNPINEVSSLGEKILMWPYKNYDTMSSDMMTLFRRAQQVGAWFSDKDIELKMTNITNAIDSHDISWAISEMRSLLWSHKDISGVRDWYRYIQSISDKIVTLMSSYEASWWNMNVFNGSMQKVAERLGNSNDSRLAELWVYVWMLTADTIKEKSGTAASDKEREFYISMMPTISWTKDLSVDRMRVLQDIAKTRFIIPLERIIQDQNASKFLFPELYVSTIKWDYSWYFNNLQ